MARQLAHIGDHADQRLVPHRLGSVWREPLDPRRGEARKPVDFFVGRIAGDGRVGIRVRLDSLQRPSDRVPGALAPHGGAEDRLSLDCIVASPDGHRLPRHIVRGSLDDPRGLGRRAADLLLADGADALLAAARAT